MNQRVSIRRSTGARVPTRSFPPWRAAEPVANVRGLEVRGRDADAGAGALDLQPVFRIEFTDEVLDKKWNVLHSCTKRRKHDLNDIQAVIEVFS